MLVTSLLRIHRIDLAEKALQKMNEMNDDATLTQLCSAYVALSKGGDKIQEAESTFQTLIDKYGESVSLLNGKAMCYLMTKRYEDAYKVLVTALSKRSDDPETLINLIICSQHMKKPKDLIQRYVR